ncbi:kinase-like protein [Phlegmacium glaucopus]|nr:kinase-like protein [Phlegmacium glaucopus]
MSLEVLAGDHEVVIIGDSAVAHGSFSDVWKGNWDDPAERRPRVVALKFLRQIIVQNVREKLLKRLQAEVLAWHRLCHRNVSQLFGIRNPEANRLKLLIQIASGIAYLHTVKPMIVHGDLKGGNILVDEKGYAIITDFGLSKVMEEMSESINMGTSPLAGSTRWMAPELIMALIHDDGHVPPITTSSDVYAFASVCFEIATGQLPYPNRTNDHAVTVDILRGIKPSRCKTCLLKLDTRGEDSFWNMLDHCWSDEPSLRPTMSHMLSFLEALDGSRR